MVASSDYRTFILFLILADNYDALSKLPYCSLNSFLFSCHSEQLSGAPDQKSWTSCPPNVYAHLINIYKLLWWLVQIIDFYSF